MTVWILIFTIQRTVLYYVSVQSEWYLLFFYHFVPEHKHQLYIKTSTQTVLTFWDNSGEETNK